MTYAKIQDVSTASTLLGRGTVGINGPIQEIALGTGLSMSGSTLSATGGAPSGSASGDLTGSYPGPSVANDAITYAKMQNVSATDKVLGRFSGGAGDVEEIACTAAGRAILDDATAAAQLTTLGGTTVGQAIFTGANPSAVRYIRVNADNSITFLSASGVLSGIGAVSNVLDPTKILVGDGVGVAQQVTMSGDGSLLSDGTLTVANHARLLGVSGGQTLIGGTASGNDLTFKSTSHGTKGNIFFGDAATSTYDEVNDRWGMRTASPLGLLHVGDSSNLNSADPSVLVSRVVNPASGSGNYHGFADNSILSRSTPGHSACSFDARVNMTGADAAAWDHYNAFQVNSDLNRTGCTLSAFNGYVSQPTVTAGTVTVLSHFTASTYTGAGTVNTQYGYYAGAMSGATGNYSFYADSTLARFGGGVVAGARSSADEMLHVYGTTVSALLEGNGVTKVGLKFKSNSTLRWDVNVPSGSTTLTFANGSAVTAASLTSGGDLLVNGGANGQSVALKSLTELLTIAAAATSDTTFQIPAGCIVYAVTVRNTVAIPTAATYTVTGATTGTVFSTAAVAVAVNTTNKGINSYGYHNVTAQNVRITPNLTPGANTGRVRVTLHYLEVTPPTS